MLYSQLYYHGKVVFINKLASNKKKKFTHILHALGPALRYDHLLKRYYDEEAILVIEPGRVARGKEEITNFFKYIFQMVIEATQISTHILQTGNIAHFTSSWLAEGRIPDGTRFSNNNIATSVFRKGADDRWRLIIDNSFSPRILDTINA